MCARQRRNGLFSMNVLKIECRQRKTMTVPKKEMNECAGWIINIHSFASAKVSVLKLGPWNPSIGKKLNLSI